jgi:hypothetical protein
MIKYITDKKTLEFIKSIKAQGNYERLMLRLHIRLSELSCEYLLTNSKDSELFAHDQYASLKTPFKDLNKTH